MADAIYDIARALNELQATTLTGPILESVLVQSRNVAKNGAMPIPPDIRKQLTGYSSKDSMNRVRYRIGDVGSPNLAILLERGGYADAVTLVDVIVFRDAIAAATVSLWAHELVHVDQFQEWGVHGFAIRYAENWQAVESPAYAKGEGIAHCACCRQAPVRPK
ncbi:eCIS core domain-containing protein [Rhizobium sp. YTU87027]|uniref:eCIS core domain-containing protein n=1 Tax=Rhizobium sp. YTU87027 TaxID=3417741 RepID=UPI003D685537